MLHTAWNAMGILLLSKATRSVTCALIYSAYILRADDIFALAFKAPDFALWKIHSPEAIDATKYYPHMADTQSGIRPTLHSSFVALVFHTVQYVGVGFCTLVLAVACG
jgi:hypothetical protein